MKGHFEPPQIMSVYDAVYRWVRTRGLRASAPAREVYRYPVDPDTAAPDQVVCDIAVPYR